MKTICTIPLIEEILAEYNEVLGKNFLPYTNHIYRVVNFCFQIKPDINDEQTEMVIIAACFHDLGIWTDDTFDYLQPSIFLANEYLKRRNLEEWAEEIELMINLHHKFRKYEDTHHPLVEIFRRADWVDVSLGVVQFDLSADCIRNIRDKFHNSGFHKRLIQLTLREFFRNPLKPLPMMKW